MNKPLFKNVIFDLDGTLTDSMEGIVNALVYALKAMGINAESKQKLMSYIGIPLQELFLKHFNISEDNLQNAVFHFREYYRKKGAFENKLYPGITDLLETLNNRSALYIATAKLESNAMIILEHFKIRKYFRGVAGADAAGIHAGKSYLVQRLFNEYHLENGNVSVMVGDKSMDVQAAHDCGIMSVGITYGYGSAEEIHAAYPTYVAESVDSLRKLLLKNI